MYNHYHPQSNFFPKRLIYNDNLDQVTAQTVAEIAIVPDQIEQDLAGKDLQLDLKSALKLAEDKISNLATQGVDKIAPTSAALGEEKNQTFIDKIITARDSAMQKIKDNTDKYQKMAAFASKEADTQILIDNNNLVLQKINSSKDNSVNTLNALTTTVETWPTLIDQIKGMDVEGTGLESRKADLIAELEGQQKMMENRAESIRVNILQQVRDVDNALVTKVANTMLPDPNNVPRFEDYQAMVAEKKNLSKLSEELKSSPKEEELISAVKSQLAGFTEMIDIAYEKLCAFDPNFQKATEESDKWAKNLDAAEANLVAVREGRNTKMTPADAEGWVAGAKQKTASTDANLNTVGSAIDTNVLPEPPVNSTDLPVA